MQVCVICGHFMQIVRRILPCELIGHGVQQRYKKQRRRNRHKERNPPQPRILQLEIRLRRFGKCREKAQRGTDPDANAEAAVQAIGRGHGHVGHIVVNEGFYKAYAEGKQNEGIS